MQKDDMHMIGEESFEPPSSERMEDVMQNPYVERNNHDRLY